MPIPRSWLSSMPTRVFSVLLGCPLVSRLPQGSSRRPCYKVLLGWVFSLMISSYHVKPRLSIGILGESIDEVGKCRLRVKRSKCQFLVPSIEFLGHLIDGKGIHPLPDKIQAIQQAPTPTYLTELKLYIGLLLYYGKFLPHLTPPYSLRTRLQ